MTDVPTPAVPSAAAIRLDKVHKRYGHHHVLDGISLDVARGGKLGLIGPAASGKSVILKLICGLEQPDRGRRGQGVRGVEARIDR